MTQTSFFSVHRVYRLSIVLFLSIFEITITQAQWGGIWSGSIHTQGLELKIDIEIIPKENRSLLNIAVQGLKDYTAQSTIFVGDSIIISYPFAKYEGIYNDDEQAIVGSWIQGQALPLTLTKTNKKTTLKRPQEPSPPFPYIEEDVEIINPKADVYLSATITRPNTDNKIPMVILVSGSGPQNRNSELLGHKPFWVIADYLSRNGIAVLRYDDRGMAKSTGNFTSSTTMDFASDAEAAFSYAKSLNYTSRVGIIGHSEGGMISPIVASRNKEVDFIATLAGPGVPIAELMTNQNIQMMKKSGYSEKSIRLTAKYLPEIYDIVNQEKKPKELYDTLIQKVHNYYDALPEKDQLKLAPSNSAYYMQLAGAFFTDWWRFFLAYDPAEVWQNVACDVLAINGDKDLQVNGKINLETIKKHLKNGKNPKATVVLLPGLNHLFQPCKKCDIAEYATIETTIDESVLKLLVKFIQTSSK